MQMVGQKRTKQTKSLKSGRPPLLSAVTSANPNASGTIPTISTKSTKQSSKATKVLINTHHNLHKSRAKAVAAGNTDLTAQIDQQIAQLGGLQAYQQASLTGQSADRGGDSSTVLVKWLKELYNIHEASSAPLSTSKSRSPLSLDRPNTTARTTLRSPSLRVLEVGALSSQNAISRAALTRKDDNTFHLIESVHRIDLKSQEPNLIQEIDFMHLPIPTEQNLKYDVISLSLVLNYVPDAKARGEMLKRTRDFLRCPTTTGTTTIDVLGSNTPSSTKRKQGESNNETTTTTPKSMPCLFIVLPRPCVSNSRYLDEDRFEQLMATLGYHSLKSHQSVKLHYELFGWDGSEHAKKNDQTFKKLEINPGKGRNNFCITL